MMNYAMILQNRVIGVLTEQDAKPRWPPSPSGKEIKAVECDDSVRIGMIYDPETGTFSEYIQPEPEPQPEPIPTQLDRIENALNVLTADSLTVSSVEAAILEGVNEI